MSKVKVTFSKYCASGFYGEGNCRCIRCCEKNGKEYNELDEHRDWIYSRVMTGETFVVENVKPMVHFDKDRIPFFGKTFSCIYTAEFLNKNKIQLN